MRIRHRIGASRRRPSLEPLESRRLLATVQWTGGGDGTTFLDPRNWEGNVAPNGFDDASIQTSGSTNIRLGAAKVNSLTMTGGTLTADSLAYVFLNLKIVTGALVVPSGTLHTREVTLESSNLTISGGSFDAVDTTMARGTLTVSSGNFISKQSATLSDGTFDHLGGGEQVLDFKLIRSTMNQGTAAGAFRVQFQGTSTFDGQIPAASLILDGPDGNGVDLLTLSSATSNQGEIRVGGHVVLAAASPLVNSGKIGVIGSSPTGPSLLGGQVINLGTFENIFGGLKLAAKSSIENRAGGAIDTSSTLDLSAGASLINQAGGVVHASGTIVTSGGSFVNKGSLTLDRPTSLGPPGLTIAGDYAQAATATLGIVLGGTAPGTDFGRLDVTGIATLGGTLAVSLAGTFLPAKADSFRVLTFASAAGGFSAYAGTSLANGVLLRPSRTATDLTLTGGAIPTADLVVAVSTATPRAYLGGNLTYVVTLTDNGPDDAHGVVLSDVLPAGASVVSVAASVGTPSNSGGVVTLALDTLASKAVVTLTLVVTLAAFGTYTDAASATEMFPSDPNPANDSCAASVAVVAPPSADLRVAISTPGSLTTTGQLAFTVTVANFGPDAAAGVVLTDTLTLPPGAMLASEAARVGSIRVVGNVVTLTFPAIPPGATFGLTVIVAATAGGDFADAAPVTSTTNDPVPGNNAASAAVTVRGQAVVSLATSTYVVAPGQALTLSAAVAPPPGFARATGQVTFLDGSTPIGMATLDASGHATLAVSTLPKGMHAITASYPGDAAYPAASAVANARVGAKVVGDFDGDGKADVALYDQTSSVFFVLKSGGGSIVLPFGDPAHANVAVPGDFDGDGKADLAIYDRSTATYSLINSSDGASRVQRFGNPNHTNVPIAGDFDGDGKADLAIYDQTSAVFFVLPSGGGAGRVQAFGNPNHVKVPVAGDFDGDGKVDLAIYDQTAAVFYVLKSGGGSVDLPFGNPAHANIPVPSDFDGDGKTDLAIYDQTSATFHALKSAGGSMVRGFGNPFDANIPVAADLDGDGKTDLVIYDQALAQFFAVESGGSLLVLPFGSKGHKNQPA